MQPGVVLRLLENPDPHSCAQDAADAGACPHPAPDGSLQTGDTEHGALQPLQVRQTTEYASLHGTRVTWDQATTFAFALAVDANSSPEVHISGRPLRHTAAGLRRLHVSAFKKNSFTESA